jgi:uncharacterized heparinase superfamily protein
MAGLPTRIGQVFRTLPHIQPRQAVAQLEHMLRGLRPPRRWTGAVPELAVAPTDVAYPPAPRHARLSPGSTLELLNRRLDVSRGFDWEHRSKGPLFAYHLHQHDYLRPPGPGGGGLEAEAGSAPRARAEVMLDWVRRHEHGTGWDPHPISMRAFTWARFFTTPGALDVDDAEAALLRRSFAQQIDSLDRNIETRLQANHLLSNLMAVALGGLVLDGEAAARWRERALWLESEIGRQIHDDGAHEERSPMYHALLLENVLDLVHVSRSSTNALPESLARELESAARRMLGALDVWTHRDGEIALFADSAFGIAQPPAELHRYAADLAVPATAAPRRGVLEDGGYVRLDAGDWTVIVSVAGPSPPHQPGHAHCDALAIELALGAERVVTDTGVFEYVAGERRQWARSTRSHSTLEVAGAEQAEIWAPHRVGGRPVVELREVLPGHRLEASCAGWSTPELVHLRHVDAESAVVAVRDLIEGASAPVPVRAAWPFAPGVAVELDRAADHARLTLPSGARVRVTLPPGLEWRIEQAPWYPEFGREESRPVLVGEGAADGELRTAFSVV